MILRGWQLHCTCYDVRFVFHELPTGGKTVYHSPQRLCTYSTSKSTQPGRLYIAYQQPPGLLVCLASRVQALAPHTPAGQHTEGTSSDSAAGTSCQTCTVPQW